MTLTRDDPWRTLARPTAMETISARRVNAEGPWDFFWGCDLDGKQLLLLQHGGEPVPARRLPRPRGIDVIELPSDAGTRPILCLRLTDAEHRDIFHSLCLDIIASASGVPTEADAVATALMRTWRWHHLLRGGGDGRLSAEKQKGLIGELLVMENVLLPALSPLDVVRAWRGPLGAPKDFEVGGIGIEAKARQGSALPFVAISSEHQLDLAGLEAVFLYVIDLRVASTDGAGESVSAVATRLRERIEHEDPAVTAEFEGLLLSAGFRWDDDYSEDRWEQGAVRLFAVTEGFPRVTAGMIPTGVSRVAYTVALHECESFLVGSDVLSAALDSGEK